MAYTEEKKNESFDYILKEIEEGRPLRKILQESDMPSTSTFYKWLEETNEKGELTNEALLKTKQYARACDVRADKLFEEILDIADKQDADVIEVDGVIHTNHNVISRSRLQFDARRWMLGKLNPKKYGDKVQQEISGELKTTPTELKVTIRRPEEEEE